MEDRYLAKRSARFRVTTEYQRRKDWAMRIPKAAVIPVLSLVGGFLARPTWRAASFPCGIPCSRLLDEISVKRVEYRRGRRQAGPRHGQFAESAPGGYATGSRAASARASPASSSTTTSATRSAASSIRPGPWNPGTTGACSSPWTRSSRPARPSRCATGGAAIMSARCWRVTDYSAGEIRRGLERGSGDRRRA